MAHWNNRFQANRTRYYTEQRVAAQNERFRRAGVAAHYAAGRWWRVHTTDRARAIRAGNRVVMVRWNPREHHAVLKLPGGITRQFPNVLQAARWLRRDVLLQRINAGEVEAARRSQPLYWYEREENSRASVPDDPVEAAAWRYFPGTGRGTGGAGRTVEPARPAPPVGRCTDCGRAVPLYRVLPAAPPRCWECALRWDVTYLAQDRADHRETTRRPAHIQGYSGYAGNPHQHRPFSEIVEEP